MAIPLETGHSQWFDFLRRELAPFPGRFNPVLRTLLSSSLVIVISMTLQIPFLALSLIMVFFITQANAAVTKMVGTMFVLGVPLSTALATLLLKFTFDYPLLRLVAASVIFIVCMFFLRTSRFSLLFFVLGFVLIYVQSLVDIVPDPEALLRTNLWVGAATFYAITITLLVNTFFLPIEPKVQFTRYLQGQLILVQGRLSLLGAGEPIAPVSDEALQRSILTLQKLLRFSAMRSDEYAKYEDYYVAVVVCVSRLLMASSALSHVDSERNQEVSNLVQACGELARAFSKRQPFTFSSAADAGAKAVPLQEMHSAFLTLAQSHAQPLVAKARSRAPFLVAPDAFKNPRYLKFALKAYFATLLCYVFYNSVDWPGIHTIMLTCVITSLPNLGASTQKGVLRISGCLIGAVLSLIAMVFVFPHLDTIFGMLFVSLVVVGFSAWICAGSDKTSYAGTQIIFCFALALLEDFGPVYDLTVIRDRLIGIVLGVAVTTAIQVLIWPESESATLLAKLGRLLGGIAKELGSFARTSSQATASTLAGWGEIADCEAMLTRVQLESTARLSASQEYTNRVTAIVSACRSLLLINHELKAGQADLQPTGAGPAMIALSNDIAQALTNYAARVSEAASDPAPAFDPAQFERRLAEHNDSRLDEKERWLRARLQQVIELMTTLPVSPTRI